MPYQRKKFRVSVRTNQISQGAVMLHRDIDYIDDEKDAVNYARMALLPSNDYSEIFVNGTWKWSGYFNKSYAGRIRNQRLRKKGLMK